MARVLVVDDEPDLRELLRVSLGLAGHEVSVAADGTRGLESARLQRPDLVVLDVMMPGLDGWTVLSSLKSDPDPGVANIPVIMLTARAEDLDVVRGGIEGAVRYLIKPFALADLRQAVSEAVEGLPEPEKRRAVLQDALVRLARLERGAAGPSSAAAHPRLSRLEPVSGASASHPRADRRGPGPGGGEGASAGAAAAQDRGAGGKPAGSPGSTWWQGWNGPKPAGEPREKWPGWLSSERLTLRDEEILRAVATSANLNEARQRLLVSRSYLYARLRTIAAKLDLPSGPALLRALRAADAARERDLD